MMLRLLLLSDIHFLSLYNEMDDDAPVRKAFLKDIEDFRKVHGTVDHILVCGDIALKGVKEEYDAAHRFFEQLCEIAGCKPEEIYIVPGNHDKNFCAPNAEIRHLIHAGLSNECVDSDRLFAGLLDKDFSHFKSLYQPFKEYQDFAVKMVSTEPLMTKCLEEGENVKYDNRTDKAYMMTELGSIGNYLVKLYAMNTALCADWDDIGDSGDGHKLFLPKLGYITPADKDGCINIAMMHHPIDNLVHGERISCKLDENFQIQIFGHLHRPVSNENGAVHIHSGAFQPPKYEGDHSGDYFSVYNILELDVTSEDGKDNLQVMLRVEKYDEALKDFREMDTETKSFVLPLDRRVNRWAEEKQALPEALPEGVTERTVKYRFLQLDNPKAIMSRMRYSYDESKSFNKNCIEFLNIMQIEHRMLELWNEINGK